jgi:hypothetical protein
LPYGLRRAILGSMLEPIAGVIARERMERWFADPAPRAGGRGGPEDDAARARRPGARARAAAALRRAADRLEPNAGPHPADAR